MLVLLLLLRLRLLRRQCFVFAPRFGTLQPFEMDQVFMKGGGGLPEVLSFKSPNPCPPPLPAGRRRCHCFVLSATPVGLGPWDSVSHRAHHERTAPQKECSCNDEAQTYALGRVRQGIVSRAAWQNYCDADDGRKHER